MDENVKKLLEKDDADGYPFDDEKDNEEDDDDQEDDDEIGDGLSAVT